MGSGLRREFKSKVMFKRKRGDDIGSIKTFWNVCGERKISHLWENADRLREILRCKKEDFFCHYDCLCK